MINDENYENGMLLPEPPLIIKPGSFKGSPEELRELILKQIEDYPEHFSMDSWSENDEVYALGLSDVKAVAKVADMDGQRGCGTTMCIAGYAQLMVQGRIGRDVEDVAKAAMNLSNTNLFYMHNADAREYLRDLIEEDRKRAATLAE
jgi:hypothetical protein